LSTALPAEGQAPFVLRAQPLTQAAFAAFGQVVEAPASAQHQVINDGFALRFNSQAFVDTAQADGQATLSIYRAKARPFEDGAQCRGLPLSVIERHLLGSQLFMPLSPQTFVVVVARAGPAPDVQALRAFVVAPGQGVNLAPGTWHHPLLALQDGDFLVIERRSPDGQNDCEVRPLTQPEVWLQL
jgi:ureidoglycolate lyase